MTNSLTGRVAVVTGATSGIGAATARSLAAAGAAVAVLGRREDRLKDLAAEIQAVPVPADVSDLESMRRAADAVRSALGPVNLVVANAGVMLAAPYESAEVREWQEMISTNLGGLVYTGRVFADDLLAAGAAGRAADLVHVGSVGAHLIFPMYAVYTATKAAVAHLTRTLRAEWGPRGVRVKNIEPGLVATELGEGMADAAAREFLAQFVATTPPLPPGDIADAITYAVAAPARMNVAELIVLPTVQG
jgi:NADP-dependent 3-hydroxy acid dehydrogenase YdfG